MKYKDILKDINSIKELRSEFINKFDNEFDHVYASLNKAVKNNLLNSIRVHKYLTDNQKLGKVNTARFLESINLDENSKISVLNKKEIKNIAQYSCEK